MGKKKQIKKEQELNKKQAALHFFGRQLLRFNNEIAGKISTQTQIILADIKPDPNLRIEAVEKVSLYLVEWVEGKGLKPAEKQLLNIYLQLPHREEDGQSQQEPSG